MERNNKMKKILIVDNEESILEALGFILGEAGYKVETRLEIGVSNVKKKLPDLILLDMRLSGKNGGEIAKKLKSDSETKNIPVILISASPINAKSVRKYGADDYIQKPFDIDFLLKKVEKYIG